STVSSTVIHADVLDLQQCFASVSRCIIWAYGSHQAATSLFFMRFTSFDFGSVRRRGFATSSMPKLTKASPAPSTAMHRPGGKNHHHAPSKRASLLPAQ